MSQDESRQNEADQTAAQRDPFEGVPPGCSPPKPWWPFWLAIIGFVVWVGILVLVMIYRFRTSVV
jgi:hypothetical protein